MSHRILPQNTSRAQSTTHHPLHRFEILATILFLSLFTLFSFLILLSKLHSSLLTGHDINISVVTAVNVSASPFFTCNADIPAGTSLKSFPCLPIAISTQDFFINLSDNGADVAAMYTYTPWTRGRWMVYNASLPNYTVQSLTQLGNLNGVYFVMTAPATLNYSGVVPHLTTLELGQGWNLVGYPSGLTQPLNESLASINDTYTEIETLEGTEENGVYLVAFNPGGGTLTNTTPFYGYWIYLNASADWVLTS